MGYSLSAYVVDLNAIGGLLGSKDERLLAHLIETHREEMLDIDAGMEFYEVFEEEIHAEYDCYTRGDFSYRPLSEPEPVEDDESALSDVVDQIEITRDLSSAGALVQMILGRDLDPKMGHLYGYMLDILAFHFGRSVDSSAFESLRSSFHWERVVVKSARQRGIDTHLLSPQSLFVHRGSPIALPNPADFPSIGYLKPDEAIELKGKLLRAGLVPIKRLVEECESEEQWGELALQQMLNWVTDATRVGQGVITVYC